MTANLGHDAATGDLSLDQLRTLCQRVLDCLGDLARVHLTIDPPTRKPQAEEPEWILRLQKVCAHVLAINGWEIEPHIEHVMASDLRAAYRQIEVVWHQLPEESRLYEKPLPDWFDEANNGKLATYDHPTPVSLALSPGGGGFSAGEDRAAYARLSMWLISLAFGYLPALIHLAEVLGKESDIVPRLQTTVEQLARDQFGLGVT